MQRLHQRPTRFSSLASVRACTARSKLTCTRSLNNGSRAAPITVCQLIVNTEREAILCKRVRVHDASLTSALVLSDTADVKHVITASLDKSLAYWKLSTQPDSLAENQGLEVQKVQLPGSPVFSLAKVDSSNDSGSKSAQQPLAVYCGTAAKEVVAWTVGASQIQDKVRLGGHTGWVRSLATSGRWLFSCGCNYLRQWDTAWPVPKELKSTKLFTGDILAIAAGGGKVYTCGADGSIRSWVVTKQGSLIESSAREKGHAERIVAAVHHGGLLYTTSFDGSIKGWSADTLELVVQVRGAHDDKRVHCMCIGSDNVLYTGGDDMLVRRWSPATLEPVRLPMYGHQSSVRVLAAGNQGCLVSGDANGEVCIWAI